MRNDRYAPSVPGWQSRGMSQSVFDTKVMPLFGLGLLMTALAAYLGRNLPMGIVLMAFVGEVILILTAGTWQKIENSSMNIGLYILFTTLSGITLVPLLRWAGVVGGPQLIAQALMVTGLTFGGLMIFSFTTKKDFSFMGRILTMAIIGLIVAAVVNIFIGGTTFSLIISFFGVLIFSGFVLYDMSQIKQNMSDDQYIMAAIMLYLDFIGLFQSILRIMGIMGGDD